MEAISKIIVAIHKENIPCLFLDSEKNNLRILIPADEKRKFIIFAKKTGWKKQKDMSSAQYLYGMDPFLYYKINDITLIVCFQLSCRSTLNGEWVPLDRCINQSVFESTQTLGQTDIHIPDAANYLCYLIAKCVYTEKNFSSYDIERIEQNMDNVQEAVLFPKLEKVFFKFTITLLQMIKNKDYHHIIEALWEYSDY